MRTGKDLKFEYGDAKQKNTQNVAVSHPWKNLCGCPIAHASDDPRPHLKTDPRVKKTPASRKRHSVILTFSIKKRRIRVAKFAENLWTKIAKQKKSHV